VLRSGRRHQGRLVGVHVVDRGDEGAARLAYVASRRVGAATRRNRAKRLLREAARAVSWGAGVDAVLVARPGCADSGRDEVLADLYGCARQLEVMDEG
jgi:ribonuclease P protein component